MVGGPSEHDMSKLTESMNIYNLSHFSSSKPG
jgi:hypothetical protein